MTLHPHCTQLVGGLDELLYAVPVVAVLQRVGDVCHAAGGLDEPDGVLHRQVPPRHKIRLAIVQPAVHGLLDGANAALFHQQLANVGTTQHGVGKFRFQLRNGDGVAVCGQLVHNGLVAGLPLLDEPVNDLL